MIGKKPKLRRAVSLFTLIMYGVGIILGAGVYALIGSAAGMTGNSLWLSFLLAAIVSSFTGLSYAELTSMFPKSAAEYYYVKNAVRSRLLAFLVGWIEVFADLVAASAVALGFAGYFSALFGGSPVLIALGLIFALSIVNFWGIKESTTLNVIFSAIEVFGLLTIIALAIPNFGSVNYTELTHGFSGVFSAAALIFFAYIGFEDLANIAEETKSPKKNLPKALLASVVITTVIYILVAISAVSLADWHELAASSAPLALAASKSMGSNAFLFLSLIALFATGNTVLILLIVGSRQIYGMGMDNVLPKFLSRVHKKTRTPWIAVFFVMLVAVAFIFFEQISIVASFTDFGTFAVFIFVNSAVIILRYKKPKMKRRFRIPINIGNLPILPVLGLISTILLSLHLEPIVLIYGLVIFIAGVPVFYILNRKGKIKI